MFTKSTHAQQHRLRTDFLVGGLIVAFTAVPIELRLPTGQAVLEALSFDLYWTDVIANFLGYVPLGIVLRNRGTWSALLIAALVSGFAEVTQLFTVDRDPAVVDVATNLFGAGLGLLLPKRFRIVPEHISIGPAQALLAAAAAVAYVLFGATFTVEAILRQARIAAEAPPWMSTNPRGSLAEGTVEARLSFDRIEGDSIEDASPNRLRATAVNQPRLLQSELGSAISLNGKQWVDLGGPVALRLTGSMTLSAWVKPADFPVDDAAIISSLSDSELGYQLDLTVDQGPRTIGFKIADASGELMARYGGTPITTDRWYHVAGVYDSDARTLDVYLNGALDNGCLMGEVTSRQRASGGRVFVGRRAGTPGFEFIGSIDEAMIESTAHPPTDRRLNDAIPAYEEVDARPVAAVPDISDRLLCKEDRRPRIAGPFVMLGMLISLACAGLVSGRGYGFLSLGLCLAVGLTAAYWAPVTTVPGAAWLAILFVPLGGGIVLAATRSSKVDPLRARA